MFGRGLPAVVGGAIAAAACGGVIVAEAAGWWPNLTLLGACLVVAGLGWLVVRR